MSPVLTIRELEFQSKLIDFVSLEKKRVSLSEIKKIPGLDPSSLRATFSLFVIWRTQVLHYKDSLQERLIVGLEALSKTVFSISAL